LVDAQRLNDLLAAYGVPWDPARADYDKTTIAASNAVESPFITDGTLFAAFAPDSRLDVMDVTDYEGANVIWKMCEPVPQNLHETYDVIFNGSVLDNIFDPAQAIRNMTRLLAPHGRIIHIERIAPVKAPN
jgi:hypothetical protein